MHPCACNVISEKIPGKKNKAELQTAMLLAVFSSALVHSFSLVAIHQASVSSCWVSPWAERIMGCGPFHLQASRLWALLIDFGSHRNSPGCANIPEPFSRVRFIGSLSLGDEKWMQEVKPLSHTQMHTQTEAHTACWLIHHPIWCHLSSLRQERWSLLFFPLSFFSLFSPSVVTLVRIKSL